MGILDYFGDSLLDDAYPREKRNFSNNELVIIENFYTDLNFKFDGKLKLQDSQREIVKNYNKVSRTSWSRFNYNYAEDGRGLPTRETATEALVRSYLYNNRLIQFSFTKHFLNKLDSSVFPRMLNYFREDERKKYIKRKDFIEYEFEKNHHPQYFTGIEYKARIGEENYKENLSLKRVLIDEYAYSNSNFKEFYSEIPTRYSDNYNIWDQETSKQFETEIVKITNKGLEQVFFVKEQEEKEIIKCSNLKCNKSVSLPKNKEGVIKCPHCGEKFYART